MDRVITDFVKALRNVNVQASPAETIDAVAAVDVVGYSNRELLKQSLSIVLSKTPEEKTQFDICFDNWTLNGYSSKRINETIFRHT